MPHLPGEQSDLPPMVSVVRNKITQKPCNIGTKPFDTAIPFQRTANNDSQSVPALFHSTKSLSRSHFRPIERLGNLAVLVGNFQPHDANVVHVRYNRRNRPSFASLGGGIPSRRRKTIDEILVDAIVRIKCVQEGNRKLTRERFPRIHQG